MSTTSPLPLQRCRSTSATESRRDSRTRDYPHAPLCVSGASSLLWRCAPILAMATSCLARSPLKNSAPYNPSGLSSTSNPCSLTGPATCPSSGNLECEMFRGDTTPSSPLGEPACGFVPQGNNTGMYQTGRAGLRCGSCPFPHAPAPCSNAYFFLHRQTRAPDTGAPHMPEKPTSHHRKPPRRPLARRWRARCHPHGPPFLRKTPFRPSPFSCPRLFSDLLVFRASNGLHPRAGAGQRSAPASQVQSRPNSGCRTCPRGGGRTASTELCRQSPEAQSTLCSRRISSRARPSERIAHLLSSHNLSARRTIYKLCRRDPACAYIYIQVAWSQTQRGHAFPLLFFEAHDASPPPPSPGPRRAGFLLRRRIFKGGMTVLE